MHDLWHSPRYASRNTPAIYLWGLQAIMNDVGKSLVDLKNHKSLSNIKKSHTNDPAPIDLEDISKIRAMELVPHTLI